MADLIDFARLLAPLSESEPCGVDLRWDAVYDNLKKARQQRDNAAFEGEKSAEPDWHFVVDQATEVLATRSKDLQIAGWLTEALLQLHGFPGVRDGLKVINGLIESFWEHLYPRPDEGDWEPRIAPLVWLTEPDRGARLGNLLRELPVAPNPNGGVDPNGNVEVYSYLYWESRSPKGGSADSQSAISEAARRAKQFDDAVAAAPRDFYLALHEALQGCRDEVARLDAALDQRLGREAPGTTAIRESLAVCHDLVRRLMRTKGISLEPSAEAAAGEAGGENATAGENGAGRAGAAGPLSSREDAFRRLREVAEFLRRTEPQSPVPYLIERAISWGEMPFDRLLQEMIKDSSARGQVVELLGITVSEQ
ncbi:MAG TPA: type VI secretion system protein TssA [Pirellulales bacterium]|jgi:type VI secretion system protein ImpA|nr:type VI secretion system protein TssA [Pirellulales bacterium]